MTEFAPISYIPPLDPERRSVDAPVKEVTMLEDRAQVLRRAALSFDTTGLHRLVILGVAPVLQDVSVIACGNQLAQSFAGKSEVARSGGYNMVTLEVTPREAELLTFIQHMRGLGQLTLSLRHPDDVSFEKDLPEIDFKRLEGALPDLNLHRQRVIRRKTTL